MLKIAFIIPFLFFISVNTLFGQQKNPIVKFSNPHSLSVPKGYTHVVEVDLGNVKMVIISGQVSTDKDGQIVGKGDLKVQLEQIFLNIKTAVESAGGKMENVVKLNNYLIDLSKVEILREVRNKYINLDNPPASTTVQVSRFVNEDFLAEIEATVIIPKNK